MRQTIANIVGALHPADALEAEHIHDTLAWIASGAPLYRIQKPATPLRHLVVYGVVFDTVRKQILLVDHRHAGLWLPSGGHVEPDEHPSITVAREIWEELQLAAMLFLPNPLFLTVTQTVGATASHTDVTLWYVLRGDCQHPLQYDKEEFSQIAWFPVDKLPMERSDPHLARFVTKLTAYLVREADNER
jgi:8-oxo-dGTP diphosphatase